MGLADEPDAVGADVRPALGEAARQRRQRTPRLSRRRADDRVEAVAEASVPGARHDEGAALELLAARLERRRDHAHADVLAQQVGEDARVGRALPRRDVGVGARRVGERRGDGRRASRRDRLLQGQALDAIDVGERPGRHVVRDGVGEGGSGFEEDRRERPLGLVERDHEVARCDADPLRLGRRLAPSGVADAADGLVPSRPAVGDPLEVEEIGERAETAGVAARGVGADGAGGAGLEVDGELAADLGGVPGRRGDRLQARRHVVRDPVGEGERVALGRLDGEAGAPAATLLVRHPDGPVKRRPGVAVGGVEQVEHLACEVEPPLAVENLGVGAADPRLQLALPRRDARVERLGRRREVVRALDPLLVEVDVDGGEPAVVEGEAGARLGLRAPRPVAVEVEQVVVESPPGPGLGVLAGVGVRVGIGAAPLAVARHVALAAVRVEARIEDHDHVAQPRVGLGRGERVERPHGRLGAHGLVAVDVVAQPDDGLGGLASPRRRPERALPHGLDVGLLGGDDEGEERPPLGSLAVALQRHAWRRLSHGLDVVDHAVVRREPFAERVPEERLGRGDLSGDAGGEGQQNEERGTTEHGETRRGPASYRRR